MYAQTCLCICICKNLCICVWVCTCVFVYLCIVSVNCGWVLGQSRQTMAAASSLHLYIISISISIFVSISIISIISNADSASSSAMLIQHHQNQNQHQHLNQQRHHQHQHQHQHHHAGCNHPLWCPHQALPRQWVGRSLFVANNLVIPIHCHALYFSAFVCWSIEGIHGNCKGPSSFGQSPEIRTKWDLAQTWHHGFLNVLRKWDPELSCHISAHFLHAFIIEICICVCECLSPPEPSPYFNFICSTPLCRLPLLAPWMVTPRKQDKTTFSPSCHHHCPQICPIILIGGFYCKHSCHQMTVVLY